MSEQDTDVGERLPVDQLVETYRRAEDDIRAGFRLVHGALGRLDQVLAGDHGFHLVPHNRQVDWKDPAEHLRHLRRQVWGKLLERMQIRRGMSIAAWKKLYDEIETGEPPEITVKNVDDLVVQFKEDMPAMLASAVKEVFNWLRPPGSSYKTNTELEIGERVILGNVVDRGPFCWRVSHHDEQYLIALENVFLMLDGKLHEKRQGDYYSALSSEVKRIASADPCHGATTYFEFRGYTNRNLHLRFRRMDLVDRLNVIAGGARLKPVTQGATR